uniref:YhdP family protein n=1 Tax=Phaeovulum sp. TaxID=2934796 RepID=UPI0035699CC4
MDEQQAKDESSGEAGRVVRPRRRHATRFVLWMMVSFPTFLLLLLLAALYVTHRPLPAPRWAIERMELGINEALAGSMQVHLGGAELVVTDGVAPRMRFLDVEIIGPRGQVRALLPEARLTLSRAALADFRIEVEAVRISGASLALRRLEDGTLDIAFGSEDAAFRAATPESLAQALTAFKQAFDAPALAALQRIDAEGMQIRLDDARNGKVWQVSAGRLSLKQDAARLAVTLSFDIGEQERMPSSVALSLNTRKHSNEASFGVAIAAVPARDVALQSPALAWLGVLDVPISGSLRSGIDASGAIGQLDARLEIGAGALNPVAGVPPVAIQGGSVHLTYNPADERVSFAELAIDSRALRLRGAGSAQLRGFSGGLPQEVLAQLSVVDLRVDPEGLFETPVQFVEGALDLRLRLDPFTLDIGQLQLSYGQDQISTSGRVAAAADGWHVALDFGTGHITQQRMLALWPLAVVAKTRNWLVENVATGELRDVRAALRLEPGAEPQLALGYGFEGAEVRILGTLPPLLDVSGYATIEGNRHALTVERGHLVAPTGGRIDVADTVLVVPDIRMRPAPAEIRLHTQSTIPAAMSLLDQEPFRFMSKAGLATDFAEGEARAETVLQMALQKELKAEDVRFRVTADLSDVRSDVLVKGRPLRADHLRLTADATGIEIAGRGTLSGVGFDASWVQRFGAEHAAASQVTGEIDLSEAGLAALGITLPRGTISGSGTGQMVLDIQRGAPTRFDLASDLQGMTLAIPSVGWRKAANEVGSFEISGTLGAPSTVERLALSAAGLEASGALTLTPEGKLASANFDAVVLDDWFEGAAVLRAQGAGNPMAIELSG